MSVPNPSPVSDNPPPEPENGALELGPWRFMIGATLLAIVALGGLCGLLFVLQPERAPDDGSPGVPVRKALQERPMPDGTVLTLEAITFGRRHELDLGRKGGALGGWQETASESTGDEALVIWLSRRSPATGQPLDFDWWGHSAAVDAHGEEIDDGAPSRNVYYENGRSGTGGSRPWSPVGLRSHDRVMAIIATSQLPQFRPPGATFKLRIYDVADQLVAEFDAPYPPGLSYPTWQPEPLPITRTTGELSVTLKGLTAKQHEQTRRGRKEFRLQIIPEFEVSHDGAVTRDWTTQNVELSDALGNSGRLWDCKLSPQESAWKLRVRLFRKPAAVDPADQWTVSGLALPRANASHMIGQQKKVNDVRVTWLALGGSGRTTYVEAAPAGHGGSSSSSGSVGDDRYHIDTDDRNGRRTTVIESTVGHAIFQIDGDTPEHAVDVQITDGQGRKLDSQPTANAERFFVFFKPPADGKTVNVAITVQKARTAEFLAAPPQLPAE